jgi:hypothetical protein
MVGLSRASDAGSTTYSTIDYAIYINTDDIRVYENSSREGVFSNIFSRKVGVRYQYIDMDIRLVDKINIVVIYFICCCSRHRSYRRIKRKYNIQYYRFCYIHYQ